MRGGRSRRHGEQSPALSDLSRPSWLKPSPPHQDPQDPRIRPPADQAGAKGVNCQKLGEAEIMVDAGIADILLTYDLIGQTKLDRLVALARGPK